MLRVSREMHAPWMPLATATDDVVFDRALERARTGSAVRLVGVLPDGRFAGSFNLNEITRGPFQNAYAGWSVSAEVAGQGYATEGVAAMLAVAFHPDGAALHRVQANILPRNARSLRVAEKCGFRREGLARAYLEIAGVWEDHVMTAIVREEWLARVGSSWDGPGAGRE